MTPNEYHQLALRTEKPMELATEPSAITLAVSEARLLHAAMGLCTEAGEFMDAIKRRTIYGKELDIVNLREEIGDLLWYLAIAIDACDTTFRAEMRRNIEKLQARFPSKFDSAHALERDLVAERAALEK